MKIRDMIDRLHSTLAEHGDVDVVVRLHEGPFVNEIPLHATDFEFDGVTFGIRVEN